tara:strand:- start:510 stop:1055 length:546 start_codon:yes stop_codon:yes gene_type:complete
MLDPSTEGKVCSKCKEWKLFYMYGARRQAIDKHKSWCKKCECQTISAYRSSPKGKETTARYNAKNWEQKRVKDAKKRAKSRNLPFNLTTEYIKSIAPPDMICPALGIQMKVGENVKNSKIRSPSLDRLIPELGYIKGNVIVVSTRANILKRDATLEELMQVAKFYEKVFKEQNPRQLSLYP